MSEAMNWSVFRRRFFFKQGDTVNVIMLGKRYPAIFLYESKNNGNPQFVALSDQNKDKWFWYGQRIRGALENDHRVLLTEKRYKKISKVTY